MNQSYSQIFFRFLRFGFLAWGGPVAQIAMIKKELVEDEKWVSKEQFNRALAVYQVLPGPEAHELCVYFGMKAGGRWGGFLAGLGFMLPGFLLMLLFTWIYIQYGIRSPLAQSIFGSVQIAVIALISFAVYRIGKHAVVNQKLLMISLISAIAFLAGVHFLLILILAGVIYIFCKRQNMILTVVPGFLLIILTVFSIQRNGLKFKKNIRQEINQHTNKSNSYGEVFLTGLKGGLFSFGGAYTAIPIMQEDAVEKKKWMTDEQFLDGIALSGILPAPLIIFATFVGYFGAGWTGAIIITIAVFLPAFCFTLVGHSVMERLIANTSLHNFLDGITAAVVGLIGITALTLIVSTINSIPAIIIYLIAVIVLIKFRSKYTPMMVITAAGLFGLISNLTS